MAERGGHAFKASAVPEPVDPFDSEAWAARLEEARARRAIALQKRMGEQDGRQRTPSGAGIPATGVPVAPPRPAAGAPAPRSHTPVAASRLRPLLVRAGLVLAGLALVVGAVRFAPLDIRRSVAELIAPEFRAQPAPPDALTAVPAAGRAPASPPAVAAAVTRHVAPASPTASAGLGAFGPEAAPAPPDQGSAPPAARALVEVGEPGRPAAAAPPPSAAAAIDPAPSATRPATPEQPAPAVAPTRPDQGSGLPAARALLAVALPSPPAAGPVVPSIPPADPAATAALPAMPARPDPGPGPVAPAGFAAVVSRLALPAAVRFPAGLADTAPATARNGLGFPGAGPASAALASPPGAWALAEPERRDRPAPAAAAPARTPSATPPAKARVARAVPAPQPAQDAVRRMLEGDVQNMLRSRLRSLRR